MCGIYCFILSILVLPLEILTTSQEDTVVNNSGNDSSPVVVFETNGTDYPKHRRNDSRTIWLSAPQTSLLLNNELAQSNETLQALEMLASSLDITSEILPLLEDENMSEDSQSALSDDTKSSESDENFDRIPHRRFSGEKSAEDIIQPEQPTKLNVNTENVETAVRMGKSKKKKNRKKKRQEKTSRTSIYDAGMDGMIQRLLERDMLEDALLKRQSLNPVQNQLTRRQMGIKTQYYNSPPISWGRRMPLQLPVNTLARKQIMALEANARPMSALINKIKSKFLYRPVYYNW